MFSTLNKLVLASALVIGGLSAGQLDANAASPGNNMGFQRGNMHGPMNWQMQRYGNRSLNRGGGYQHYHNGYYYQNAWWAVPFVIGGLAVAGSSHVEWCSAHYRSYNPDTESWYGNGGQRHRCQSGY